MDVFKQLKQGNFPNEKNKVWTICQCALKLAILACEEAERSNLTDEQFYIEWENSINLISVKDHSGDPDQTLEFEQCIKKFIADSK